MGWAQQVIPLDAQSERPDRSAAVASPGAQGPESPEPGSASARVARPGGRAMTGRPPPVIVTGRGPGRRAVPGGGARPGAKHSSPQERGANLAPTTVEKAGLDPVPSAGAGRAGTRRRRGEVAPRRCRAPAGASRTASPRVTGRRDRPPGRRPRASLRTGGAWPRAGARRPWTTGLRETARISSAESMPAVANTPTGHGLHGRVARSDGSRRVRRRSPTASPCGSGHVREYRADTRETEGQEERRFSLSPR